MEEQLRLLQEQYDQGFISEAVYNQRRQAMTQQVPYNPMYTPPVMYNPTMATNQPQINMNAPQSVTGITSEMALPNNTGMSQDPAYATTYTPPVAMEEEMRLQPRSVQDVWNQTYTPTTAENTTLAPNSWEQQSTEQNNLFGQMMPFFNPYGSNLQTDLYSLGNFIGTPRGTTGRGLGVASSATALGLGAGRTFLSGLANAKQTGRATEEARRQMALRLYTPQMQYMNTNYLGGTM